MPASPEEREPAPSPMDGPPPVNPPIDFSDLVTQMKAHGLIEPDPITPAEAAEEMDDAEAEELAKADAAEALADGLPGANRTWAELDASTEADRRFHLDSVEKTAQILAMHARPFEEDSGDIKFRLSRTPQGFEDGVSEFLEGVRQMGIKALGRLNDHA